MADNSAEAPPRTNFARKARKSILDINIGQQTTQKMSLRANKARNAIPFKAGRIHYEPPKFLSSAATPPRMKKRSNTSTSLTRTSKSQDRQTEEPFVPAPIMLDIADLPFEPIKDSFDSTYFDDDKENKTSPEEWMAQEAEKFIPEPVDPTENPFTVSLCEEAMEASEEEHRDIKAEIAVVKTRLDQIGAGHIYLNRKIPNIETMLEQTDAFTENDVLGAWDVLLNAIQKVFDRADAEAAKPQTIAEEEEE